jgi:hypothetical protein
MGIDKSLQSLAEQAVREGLLTLGSPGYVITQQVIHQGLESLSSKDRQIYLTEVVPALSDILRRRFGTSSTYPPANRRN